MKRSVHLFSGVAACGIDGWIGGVRLRSPGLWRYDEHAGRIDGPL